MSSLFVSDFNTFRRIGIVLPGWSKDGEINTARILGLCRENRPLDTAELTPRVSGWCHLSGVNAEPMAVQI